MRVCVPLGAKGTSLRCGYITALTENSGLKDGIKCREIIWPLESSPLLDNELLALARDLASRQGIKIGSVFGHVLPAGLRMPNLKLRSDGIQIELGKIVGLDNNQKQKLANEFMEGKAIIEKKFRNDSANIIYYLRVDPPWPIRPAARRQRELLDFIYERGFCNRKALGQKFGSAAGKMLERMITDGLVGILDNTKNDTNSLNRKFEYTLNEEQQKALQEFTHALKKDSAQCRLLYGITGSGKTAVYMELAKKCLEYGRSILILAPEVALAHKLRADTENFIRSAPVYFFHGYQLPSEREKIFSALKTEKQPCIVIGTRSALFLPVNKPGCIILDEEHDASFKQDEGLLYHAKEVAWFRTMQNNGLLVLGSATPDLKTFFAACNGSLQMARLENRISGNKLPAVELVDMGMDGLIRGSLSAGAENRSILTQHCENALLECMDKGEQAIILLNRRGYSPMIYCVNCSKILHCPNCEIGLAYHKNTGKLLCHYCGYSVPYPAVCPDCGKTAYLSIGEGTERLAESLETLAGKPVLRLDRDNVRRPGKIEEVLEAFRCNESPFLVGTQMLSKGHHFPNVTLAIVADGDIGLNLPDYRAAERTFQLLLQSSGRAGRGEKAGKVLIQTRNINHYCWKYVINGDYEGFYREELARRQKRNYPPYTKLGLLKISYPVNETNGSVLIKDLGNALAQKARLAGVNLLGPSIAPIGMLRGRKRFQCLLKSDSWQAIRELYFYAIKQNCAKFLKIILDLDPVNML